ncbi:unnamed protein product [Absidia cylindrospora]
MDYFSSPGPNSHYKSGDTISFVVEDMPDEDDQNVNANLYKADQSLVKTIQTWNSQNVDESGEEFPFQWLVDVTESGQYYVEISVGHTRDDVTQSYPFTIEVDDEATTDTSESEPSQSDYAQQMSEEQEVPVTTSKLSLHNKQSQVAHISSHSDIDTVSDDAAPSAGDFQPQSKLSQLATSLTSNLPLVHHKPSAEPLMPKTSPSANMKQLEAADDIAVAREKAWIAKQQQTEPIAHRPSSKKIKSTHKAKHHSNIDKEITAQAKKVTDKAQGQVKKAKQEEKDRQTLTLAQQEAKDDQDTKHHAKHQAVSHSKQKRDAYRVVMRNRAKFAKQELLQ